MAQGRRKRQTGPAGFVPIGQTNNDGSGSPAYELDSLDPFDQASHQSGTTRANGHESDTFSTSQSMFNSVASLPVSAKPDREPIFDAGDESRLERGSTGQSVLESADSADESDGQTDAQARTRLLAGTGRQGPLSFPAQSPSGWSGRRKRMAWLVGLATVAVVLAAVSVGNLVKKGQWDLREVLVARPHRMADLVSNGTTLFAPTTIVISLDGFRPDYLARGVTPALSRLAGQPDAIHADYMLPAFPSLTFPNHYTMLTGLYPASHGIVANLFWDSAIRKQFHSQDSTRDDPTWWGGEPIWRTAERQDVRTAMVMWPGSNIRSWAGEFKVPTTMVDFDGRQPLEDKTELVLSYLDRPGPTPVLKRNKGKPGSGDGDDGRGSRNEWVFPSRAAMEKPQLVGLYVPDVDRVGHKVGPDGAEVNKTLAYVDSMIGAIVAGIEARNLTGIVNVVVVSDHGMARSSAPVHDKTVRVADLIDAAEDLAWPRPAGWPMAGLWPSASITVDQLAAKVRANLARVLPEHSRDAIKVYVRDKDMPDRYHYTSNKDRIAPVWLVPEPGWLLLHPNEELSTMPNGVHGYDPVNPEMHALFIARGPAFNRTTIASEAAGAGNSTRALRSRQSRPSAKLEEGQEQDADGGETKIEKIWSKVVSKWKSFFSDEQQNSRPDPTTPARPSAGKGAAKVLAVARPFENVNLYGFLCESVKIEAAPNNGTLTIRDLVLE